MLPRAIINCPAEAVFLCFSLSLSGAAFSANKPIAECELRPAFEGVFHLSRAIAII